MPRVFFFIIFISAVIIVFGLAEILLLRLLNRPWWERRWVRRAAWALPASGLFFFLLFGFGEYYKIDWLAVPAAALAALSVILEIGLMFSLPLSGLFHLADFLAEKVASRGKQAPVDRPIDQSRRIFLKGAAAAMPVASVAMGLTGVGSAFTRVTVDRKELPYTDLPDDLAGLRILHLSDLHLRHYTTLSDLETTLQTARQFSPDLVLVTGDVADDLQQLPEALNLIAQLKAPLGNFATLGNHEYFRGVETVKQVFANSPVTLLVDHAVTLSVGNSRVHLGGIDDPVHMGQDHTDFFSLRMPLVMGGRDADDFSVLMSHRPDVFPLAAREKVDLTLSGHTHGGQIGLFGRSLLERWLPERYLWGRYEDGRSQLYTSCGMGHWFPFRLGCPQEAPVLELVKA
ncbi:MAG: metallophosphoesterase [candidate division Zixibacteria bacterium]|nr:metallophosphoesterase [candidate division Zixibacteria bacterium]